MSTKLDFTVETIEERLEIVNKILEEVPEPSADYLETLGTYLIFPINKAEKKLQKRIINSKNRRETINKYEISYEGLAASLESGEDGIYNLMGDKNRRTKMNNIRPISQEDIEKYPEIKQLRESIDFWKEQAKNATGKRAFNIKKIIIETSRNQYYVRDSLNPPIAFANMTPNKHVCKITDSFNIDKNGNVSYTGVSLCSPYVCSNILCNYSKLKQEGWDALEGDLHFLMIAFDKYCGEALKSEPILEQIVIDKIDGMQNNEIQDDLLLKFGTSYTVEYISSLYRNKIPKLIASVAEDDYIQEWFLNHEKGTYKKCSRCGNIKLAHTKYFSKNPDSNDGFYSICKDCRNTAGKNS